MVASFESGVRYEFSNGNKRWALSRMFDGCSRAYFGHVIFLENNEVYARDDGVPPVPRQWRQGWRVWNLLVEFIYIGFLFSFFYNYITIKVPYFLPPRNEGHAFHLLSPIVHATNRKSRLELVDVFFDQIPRISLDGILASSCVEMRLKLTIQALVSI